MIPALPTVRYGRSTLVAVPAVHGDHVFAAAVRRFCLYCHKPPAAVAVELGPHFAQEAASWIREIAPAGTGKLPVMLGLLGYCRLVKPSLREKAFALQRKNGRSLQDLPPDVLKRELGFSSTALLCLSPTDSIIEAIRCSIEWDIPLHGVDLEEVADAGRDIAEMGDSLTGREDIVSYVERYAPRIAAYRDAEVDGRREIVMAARLKTLLEQYESVLFTGGLGHWSALRRHLADPFVKPSRPASPPCERPRELMRVIVHPRIAAPLMDRFPLMAQRYEEWRAGASAPDGLPPPEPAVVLRKCLRAACHRYFSSSKGSNGTEQKERDWDSLRGFETYLRNLSILSSRNVPNLSLLLTAAMETLSREFSEVLVEALMDLPWVSSHDYPDCPLLSPELDAGKETEGIARIEYDGTPPALVTLRHLPGGAVEMSPLRLLHRWNSEYRESELFVSGQCLHTWLPWDYRNAAMCFRAARKARTSKTKVVSETFGGSLLEGIDIKATLRAFSGGRENYFVRERIVEARSSPTVWESFPIVWILEPDAACETDGWMVLREPIEAMEPHVKDKDRLRKVEKKRGRNMVSSICRVNRKDESRTRSGGALVESIRLHGQVIFHPPHSSHRQSAVWAETTGYRLNPFFSSGAAELSDESDLGVFYTNELRQRVGELPWTTLLVLLALPFAVDVLPVVVPDRWQLDPLTHWKAAEYGITVRPVPLGMFSDHEIQRMMTCTMSYVVREEPYCIFPTETEQIIGESQSADRERLPQNWLHFDLENTDIG
jgi:hypothetical protein